MKKILMLFVLMMFAECSYAMDGNQLSKDMIEYEKQRGDESTSWFSVGSYNGYVEGVADATENIMWCAPGQITLGQMFKIVSKYLNNNPQNLHFSASSLVVQALKDAFPCKK